MKARTEQGTIILLGALAILSLFVCMTRYADYDLWWHLKLGESLVANWRIPSVDTFSYTAFGRSQFAGEWLGDGIIFLTFKLGGFPGLNLLKTVLLLITFYFIYILSREQAGRQGGYLPAAVITLVIVLFAIRFRLFVRPYLFSLPLLSIFLYLLDRWRSGNKGKAIFCLPVLMLFWANMSVGAVFGLFVLGVAALLELVEQRSPRLLSVLGLTILASLVNPESYKLYTLAIDLTSDPYRALIGEYQPITRDILFGSGLRYTLCFQVLAVGSLLYFIFCRGWKNFFQLVIFVFFLYESFRQVRLVELFSIVAAPCFAGLLANVLTGIPAIPERFRQLGNIMAALLILTLVPLTVLNSKVYAFGAGPKENAFPEGAIRFMDLQGIKGKMFNSYGYGGYLIWRAPDRPVFIDGRYRRLYTPAEYGEYKGILENAGKWQAAEQKYGFDYAVLEYDLMSRRFPAHLPDNKEWALVYWDNCSLVYLKRSPERAELIARNEYKLARPAFLDFSYLDSFAQSGRMNEALAGLDREIALNPQNQFVVLARVYLRYQMGKMYLPQIKEDLEKLLPLKPDFAMKHSALAMILAATGEPGRAKGEVLKALKLDPLDQAALSQAKALGIEVKIPKGAIPGHP
jgi:hypothetical protein